MSTYAQMTYRQIIDSVRTDITDDALSGCSDEWMQSQILLACQHITDNVRITEQRTLNLIVNQDEYPVQDSATPISGSGRVIVTNKALSGEVTGGTGTVTSSGATITGIGTIFKSELSVGEQIIIGTYSSEILTIDSDVSLTVSTQPDSDITTASAFTYSGTKFTRELVSGSIVAVGSVYCTIASITDAYNAVLTTPIATNISTYTAFTIDTAVSEIPTRFDSIFKIDRTQDALYLDIKPVDISELITLRQNDLYNIYSVYNIPYCAAFDMRDGTKKVLKFYKPPDTTKACTLHAVVKIKPRAYTNDALTAYVPLSETYEPAITNYVRWKTYRWLYNKIKEANYNALAQEEYNLYVKAQFDLRANAPSLKKMEVVYQ